MSDATRIISRFRQLLDVQVSRASAVWQRLNADGTVTDRTAADMRVDLGLGNSATLNTGTTSGTVATGNHTHAAVTTSVNGFMSAADKTKLNGIATSATANSSDAFLTDRANHTGNQAIATVTGLQTELDGKAPTTVVTDYISTHELATVAGVVAVDASNGRSQRLSLTADVTTFELPTNLADGQSMSIVIHQNGSMGETFAFNLHSSYELVGGGTEADLSAMEEGRKGHLSIRRDQANYLAFISVP